MRVIAGTHRGRRLHGPKGGALRPTADRVKEALFSILSSRVAGSRFLDLYAGTGAIGIEALSRGAQHVTFVESDRTALRLLRTNLLLCGLTTAAEIHACAVGSFLTNPGKGALPYNIVFADPPYGQDQLERLWPVLADSATIAPEAVVVVEHSSRTAVPSTKGRLSLLQQYRYGDTMLSVYTRATGDSGTP